MSYPYPLVVFDLDGTLVDSASDIAEALNRTLEAIGMARVPEATVLGWIGDGVRRLVEQAVHAAGLEVDLAEVMPVFMVHYRECLLRSPRLFDGVAEALAQLRARDVPLAICTNKPEALVPPLLQHLGIGDAFALVLGGDSLPQRKPSGEPLRHIATHFGLPVQACLMVGDSLTDYRAAEDAGMPIALVRYGYPRGLDLASAHAVAVIDDLRELPGLTAGVPV
ncbi:MULTISPECIES: phosphoglycolate phosphatase [Stenotrophomonas maltophilia group]|uniref:Phosphoglycolate phosphatase n=1 Tax=Stenotrophomonas maltophilia TaxID=40324 RepID=A0A246IAX9_STEMA|nr:MULTISPECIES: phosphoglycolate phosphatase [Stenotrophomonas maltophilia group]MCO5737526.1 phosphoglycolate phosphatase [Stenotrophomonas maltophilia]OWQ76779.1 phosphoglycolate phosphatase [Stenotrophomonas maltophilia]PZT23468.1 phosphoglycolate phosphatase, bacterial [Stenotrophomonas maltophilia]PZT35305.1 phosphoglycolate phosphatase, bacterial [Stenotrophomonas sepilia]